MRKVSFFWSKCFQTPERKLQIYFQIYLEGEYQYYIIKCKSNEDKNILKHITKWKKAITGKRRQSLYIVLFLVYDILEKAKLWRQ